MTEKYPHQGITMHQLGIGGNFPGLLFAAGSALIFLLAIPALWYFTLGALVVGLLIAAVLQIAQNKRSRMSSLRTLGHTRVKWYREL